MRLGGGEGGYECILNEASDDDCSTVCGNNGYSSCSSIGTDSDDCNNNWRTFYRSFPGACDTENANCGMTISLEGDSHECDAGFGGDEETHSTFWTYCHCE